MKNVIDVLPNGKTIDEETALELLEEWMDDELTHPDYDTLEVMRMFGGDPDETLADYYFRKKQEVRRQ